MSIWIEKKNTLWHVPNKYASNKYYDTSPSANSFILNDCLLSKLLFAWAITNILELLNIYQLWSWFQIDTEKRTRNIHDFTRKARTCSFWKVFVEQLGLLVMRKIRNKRYSLQADSLYFVRWLGVFTDWF